MYMYFNMYFNRPYHPGLYKKITWQELWSHYYPCFLDNFEWTVTISVIVFPVLSVYSLVCPDDHQSVCPSINLSIHPPTVFLSLSLGPSVSLSVCRLPVCLSAHQSESLSSHVSDCWTVCLCRLSDCQPVCLCLCPSVCPSICLSVRLSVRLFVCLSTCLSACLFVGCSWGVIKEQNMQTKIDL